MEYTIKTINELCTKITDGSHFSPEHETDGLYPMYSVKDMEYNNFSNADCKMIGQAMFDKLSKADCRPLKNDILIAKDGSYLKCAFKVNEDLNACILSSIAILRPNLKNIDPDYFVYLMRTKSIKGAMANYVSGSALPRIILSDFKKMKLKMILSLPTQQKIASILSAYDKLIQNYKKQIEALQTAASELYKEWFVRFRFLGWKNAKFENGIPEGWKIERLTKLVGIKYGKDHSKLDDGNIPVYGSGGIMRYCNKALYDKETVLIPRKGSLNNIMYANRPLWTVDTMFYSIMLRKNFAKYLYYVLSKIDMESFNAGAALPSMTTEILSHFKIIVPDNKTLELFDNKIALIFTQIDNLQQQITNLTQQRDLLLPRLMSGKLEVK